MSSGGAPWWAFIFTAVVALSIAAGGWLVGHHQASKRDLQNWRRTTLLQAVSTMIEASNSRYDIAQTVKKLHQYSHDKELLRAEERKMLTAEYQIRICITHEVGTYATAIIKQHQWSTDSLLKLETKWGHSAYEPVQLMSDEEIAEEEARAFMDKTRLHWNHDQLIEALQVEIKLRKYERNPDHAYVLTKNG